MKILHTFASPAWSGPAEAIAQLAVAQRELGHEVTIAIDRKRQHTDSEETAATRLAVLELLDDGVLELSVKSSLLAMWRDVRALRRRDLDVVHCHFSHDHAVAFFGHPPGAVVVRSIHAPRSLSWATPKPDAFTVPTEALALALPSVPHLVLPALVGPEFKPLDKAAVRAELGVTGEPVIGIVSTFQPSRRHQIGIDAFSRLHQTNPRAHLLLVGDGELEVALRARVLSLGLKEAVTFVGYQGGENFVKWLNACDEVWVLGLGNDYSGRAAAQARACGARVVAVDEGALPQWADAVVQPHVAEIVAASGGARRVVPLERSSDVARKVLALYEQVRK